MAVIAMKSTAKSSVIWSAVKDLIGDTHKILHCAPDDKYFHFSWCGYPVEILNLVMDIQNSPPGSE